MQDLVPYFKVVFTIKEADVALLWQDIIGYCKSYANLAKAEGKKVVVIQHGLGAMDDYGPPNSYELIADKICVWSQNDVDMLKRYGIPDKKIELTGTTIWSHLKPKTKHEGVNVLFKPAHWDVEVEENYLVRDALRKIKGINVITKVHESHKAEKFDNPIITDRESYNHLEVCGETLAKTDIIVGVGNEGTLGMMGYIKDIPMIIPNVWKPRPFLDRGTQEMKYTDACHLVALEDLETAVKNAIEHPGYKRFERSEVAEYYGGANIENPLDKIIKTINEV